MTYAHSANALGVRHTLEAHLEGVAELTASFAEALGASELGYYLGRWHDLGKASKAFQQYLLDSEAGRRPRRGPDHKAAGALLAQGTLGPLAMVLQGHHGGLTSIADYEAWLAERQRAAEETLQATKQSGLCVTPASMPALPAAMQGSDYLSGEFFVRMLFSALVDADYLDTARHFNPAQLDQLPDTPSLEELWHRYLQAQEGLSGKGEGIVNRVRHEVYQCCIAAAAGPTGLYRLAVPTGGGKTRSALGFALAHALRHNLRRIVVAVPFLSITDQTAQVYRSILETDDRPVVLEHHSATNLEEIEADTGDWARLAAENWDAPVIITTTVQLLESLFAAGPQRARKIHRLAQSVIILDEVQALPVHLLEPILDVLRRLAKEYGTTVVLSTATQPAFDLIPGFADATMVDMVPNAREHYAALKRVRYEMAGDRTWEEIADEMAEQHQAMAIVNTKSDAMTLLDALNARGEHAMHLSTQLCGAHRKAVLIELKDRLSSGERCLLVTTQVVEAGVDIDFPVVFRAMAPLDSIIQAAGRCNRENRRAEGRVVVFEPVDGHTPPGFYKMATGSARATLAQGVDLDTLEGTRGYYEKLYQYADTDSQRIQPDRRALDFARVDEKFHIIDSATVPVVITNYDDNKEAEEILDQLERRSAESRKLLRRLQPYIVGVYARALEEFRQKGLVTEVMEGVYRWFGQYDPIRGLVAKFGSAEESVY
ncbi:MAG: CRISPR-associated helicase Cas3' [Anaerolineae bacterium]|jgi:CRISPR-associated endonuclease/helicase Cas3|nr:CRISPR-associated helicase Cas3' [Chloroflexota bacterium]